MGLRLRGTSGFPDISEASMHLPGIEPADESERWMDVKVEGYPRYYVSDWGRVASWFHETPRLMKPSKHENGYLHVRLTKDGVPKSFPVAHLVLTAFVGPCPEGQEACHNDGRRSNNKLTNLRWDTHVANMWDRIQHGTHPLKEAQVAEAKRLLGLGYPYDSIAKHLSVRVETISNLFHWEFTQGRMAGVDAPRSPRDTHIPYKG
jgi:hypothetical protein